MTPRSAGEFIDNTLRDIVGSIPGINQEYAFVPTATHKFPFMFVESREEDLSDRDEGMDLVQSWTRAGFGVLGVGVKANANGDLKREAERHLDIVKRAFQAQRRVERSIAIDGTKTRILDIALSRSVPTYDDATTEGLVILEFTITGTTSTL